MTATKETIGQSALDAKLIDHRELIIAGFARGVLDEWITIVHGTNFDGKFYFSPFVSYFTFNF
jgi:hypothetical protein